jgi:prophage maintenance system killer protein
MIDAQQVIEIHDLILRQEPGLAGGHGIGPLEGALARVACFTGSYRMFLISRQCTQ